ncbi:pentatricopeptide repeat-containing protein At5g15010, mitochondrial [Impatiens glandulifera]|uniref:pentatricopeptide repeat-containing protein At5g15010, mitochondrial n=1 Tax=Impatiens glandulifera TaxID=253017 RepID=UPI001FB0A4A7|nr:pentatricopeptide repeat-containing protein At5g15010, mitochondrial [Impatiens glandulifera]XP_047329574.1 pentatricopeptide repeat-containing protein At5g15010, mitochondrial [Impatiens glandulifera]
MNNNIMWRQLRKMCEIAAFSSALSARSPFPYINTANGNFSSLVATTMHNKPLLSFHTFTNFCSYSTSSVNDDFNASTVESDDENNNNLDSVNNYVEIEDDKDVSVILDVLASSGGNQEKAKSLLDQCGLALSSRLVMNVLSGVRNDWEAALTFFHWAGNQTGYEHSWREYHSMISILGKMRKFDIAWSLIKEMTKNGESLVTHQTLAIMIRRYCAAHEVKKAIDTFYAHKLFKLDFGMEEFQHLIFALCRYKNVKAAESLLLENQNIYPFNTKSFNIVLNGWCNTFCSPREARNIWREMSERGIKHDVVSYSCMISCYSKSGKTHHMIIKLFNQMKALGIKPDRKVYNIVIHALTKSRLVNEAREIMKEMEQNGVNPNSITYNSLIQPLCKSHQLSEVRGAFSEMLERGLLPTISTYHALFEVLRTGEETFSFLEKMRETGCPPNNDTYVMLIRKFCRWRDFDTVFKLWNDLNKCGGRDRSAYVALIHGLFLNGKLEEANKYNCEMKEKHFLPEPKLDERLQIWASGRNVINLKNSCIDSSPSADKSGKIVEGRRRYIEETDIRRVVIDRGFSLLAQ